MAEIPGTEVDPGFDEMLAATAGIDLSAFSVASKTAKFAEFPLEEYTSRYARACRLMEHEGLYAVLVTQDLNVRYFAGYLSILWASRFRPYVAILPRDSSLGPTLIVPAQETGNATHTSWIADLVIYPDQENPIPYIAEALAEKGLDGKIGTELGFGQRIGMTVNQLEALKTTIAPAELVDATPLTQAVRMIKSPREVDCLRRACAISQAGIKAGYESLVPGMSEKELASVIGSTMYAEGAELGTQPSFFGLNAGPERYKVVNALASEYRIQPGDLVMADCGAVYHGYSTDFIRQACLGEPTAEQRKWFSIAVEANQACIEAIRPGVTGADVYEAGIAVFEREGLLDYNVLNIVGHGTGMEIHELPWLGERDSVYTAGTVLQPGMVVCIEPIIAGMDGPDWRAGLFIVEEKVLVTDDGAEVLTDALSPELWVQPITETSA